MPAKTSRARTHCFKHCNFLNRDHWFHCHLWALSRKSFKLEYPINAKKPWSAFWHLWSVIQTVIQYIIGFPATNFLGIYSVLFYWSIWWTLFECSDYTSHAVNRTAFFFPLDLSKEFNIVHLMSGPWETGSLVFPRVLMFPEKKSRETSGLKSENWQCFSRLLSRHLHTVITLKIIDMNTTKTKTITWPNCPVFGFCISCFTAVSP